MRTKSTLQQQAYDFIKEKILSGELSPDNLYSETKFSSEVGISRTPMREALQCLSQDGYITIIPSKGFQITRLSEKDMYENIQIRCAIECFCTTIITSQTDTPKFNNLLNSLEDALSHMKECAAKADYDHTAIREYITYDNLFHNLIVDYSENDEIKRLYQKLMYMISVTAHTLLSTPYGIEQTLSDHKAYYDAIKNGRGDEAYSVIFQHIFIPIENKIFTPKEKA